MVLPNRVIAARNSRIRGRVCKLTQPGLLGREVRNDAERGLHEHLDRGWSGSPLGKRDPGGWLRLVHGSSMRVNRGLVNWGPSVNDWLPSEPLQWEAPLILSLSSSGLPREPSA